MTSVITVPPSLDDQTFEQVVEQLASVPHDAKLLVDAQHTRQITRNNRPGNPAIR